MKRRGPLFLARRGYRRRRLRDAARLLPVLAIFLMILPMLWGRAGQNQRDTASDAIYLFLAWGALVLLAAALSYVLSRGDAAADEDET